MDPITEWWEERAAIMEFDGGMGRGEAEYAAYALALRHCERAGEALPYAGYFYTYRLSDGARLEWSDDTCSAKYISPRPKRARRHDQPTRRPCSTASESGPMKYRRI